MSDPYRTSALSAPSRKRVAFGTGELLVLHVPMPPAEVVDRLRAITQEHRPTIRDRRLRSHRPFWGTVHLTQFRLAPLGVPGGYLRVDGTIRPEGETTVLVVRVTLLFRGILLAVASLALTAALVVWLPFSADSAFFYAVRIIVALVLMFGGVAVAVRFGISHANETILAALDPTAASRNATALPEFSAQSFEPEELIKRLDEWESKHLK